MLFVKLCSGLKLVFHDLDQVFHKLYYTVSHKKFVKKLLIPVLASILIFSGISTIQIAYAGAADTLSDFDSKFIKDDTSLLDLTVNFVDTVPTSPEGFFGTGMIIGTDGAGNPVLRVGTSHAFVCDSETQVLGVCSGIWHNHDAVLRAPVDLPPVIDSQAISDCFDQGATFEVDALSFESPGTISVLGNQISMNDVPKTSVTNTNVIPQPFINNYDFSQNPLVQQLSYPVVKFTIFVATADGSPALDSDGVPIPLEGERRVCIFDVMAMDSMIGGELLSIESTSLLVSGVQSTTWLIPVVLSIVGIGLFVVSRKSE